MQQFYSGVVEDRNDNLMLGRCRVRIVGVHNEHVDELPTKDLPWAHPMTPITSAAMNGIGETPLGPVEGTWVIVFFKDGEEMQQPVMIGTIGGIPVGHNDMEEYASVTEIAVDKIHSNDESVEPTYTEKENSIGFKDPNGTYPRKNFLEEPDTNRLARGQKLKTSPLGRRTAQRKKGFKIANSTTMWDQPKIPYFASYPFNHVRETESGHVVEYDDTPMAERMCHMHTTGTFTEIDASGSQVNRIIGNGYQIIDKDGFVQVSGSCIISVDGDASVRVGGAMHVDVANKLFINTNNTDVEFKCKDFKLDCNSFNLTAVDKLSISTGKDVSIKTGAAVHVKASAVIAMDGSQVHMNSGKAVPVAPLPVNITYTPMLFADPALSLPHTEVNVAGLSVMDSVPPRKLDLLNKALKK